MVEKTTSQQKTTSEILETQADDPILWEFVATKWFKKIQQACFFWMVHAAGFEPATPAV